MFTLCVRDSFAAAHRLVGYEGKCENLHGHNFAVDAFFSGEQLDRDGLLIDFKILKEHLKNVLDSLDHKYLNEISFFAERASSAEYIAMFIYEKLAEQLSAKGVSVKKVHVWESEKAYAAYEK